MADTILVLNAGSSSLKFSLFLAEDKTLQLALGGQLQGLYTAPKFHARDTAGTVIGEHRWEEGHRLGHDGAIAYLTDFLRQYRSEYQLVAVGHRVVHGGIEYSAPVRVNADTIEKLDRLVPLAPLHQPHNLAPIKILLQRTPPLPQVACFDTAFHHTHPPVAQAFALPPAITERGVRRYGFHGLSYEYIASVLPEYDAQAAAGRSVVLHLGNGASMCALHAGKSIASTMGFTAMDGLPMGTRCGNLDPGVILYLIDELGMDARAIEKLLYEQSGLLGVSGVSSDMRTLEASQDPRAQFAIELFVYRIGRELGSLAAALGGVDALVFTAGIGEHSARVRERVCREAAWLGVELDATANAKDGPRISGAGSRVSVWVMPTNEELMIAHHTQRVLLQGQREPS
jgi:acetate kinase